MRPLVLALLLAAAACRKETKCIEATTVTSAVPLDLPPSRHRGTDVQSVLSVVLTADGKTFVDADVLVDDDALKKSFADAKRNDPDVRVVIKAESSVPHGRVVHVLDLAKQENIHRIAFGVSPLAPAVAP